jgi:hypothetical protein
MQYISMAVPVTLFIMRLKKQEVNYFLYVVDLMQKSLPLICTTGSISPPTERYSLQSYCEFYDQEYRSIIKHISTRWLSLELAIERSLRQFISLRSYFLSEDDRLDSSGFTECLVTL